MSTEKPTFQQACRRHGLGWQQILDELDANIRQSQAYSFYQFGRGYPNVVDACLISLSRLSRHSYTRENITCEIWSIP
jgi:hypothetical protein